MLKNLLLVVSCAMMYLASMSQAIRQVPDELSQIVNTTKGEDDTTHCMEQFKNCLNPQTAQPICAINALTDNKLPFQSICEMIHENCRTNIVQWHYLNDDEKKCNGSLNKPVILRNDKKPT